MSSVHSQSVHTESSAEQIQSDPSSSPSVETKLGLEKSFSEVSQSAASIEGPALGAADAQNEKSSSPTQFYRRRALQLLGIGGAAFAGVFSSRLASFWNSTAPLSQRSKGKGTGPWWLLSPLSAGMSVGYGWKLESLSSVQDGAVVLELAKHGEDNAQVHICVYEGQPSGVAHTTMFDLLLMDGRKGEEPTPEALGRVVMGIAQRIQRNELREVDWSTVKGLLTKLQTHPQRVERYGAASLLPPELASLIPVPPDGLPEIVDSDFHDSEPSSSSRERSILKG